MKKRILAIIVCVIVLFSSATTFATTKNEAYGWNYGYVSNWAYEQLVDAVANGIVLDSTLVSDCSRNITRQEFATLVVNLYRALVQEDPAPAISSTFSDTTDFSVRVAYNLGIINGAGNGKFLPYNSITREQMGVMILNTVKALNTDYKGGDGVLAMSDKDKVSSWAVKGVDFVYENDFMKGDGIIFNPKGATTVEQAIAIANRVFKKYQVAFAKNEPTVPAVEFDISDKGYFNETINGTYIDYDDSRVVAFPYLYKGMNYSKLSLSKYYGGGQGTKVYFALIGKVQNLTLTRMVPPSYAGSPYKEEVSVVLGDGNFKDVLMEIEYEEKSYDVAGAVTNGSGISGYKNYVRISFDVPYPNGYLHNVKLDLRPSTNNSSAKPVIYPMVFPY